MRHAYSSLLGSILFLLSLHAFLMSLPNPALAMVFEVSISDAGLSPDNIVLYKGVDTIKFRNNISVGMALQSGINCTPDGNFQCGYITPGNYCQPSPPSTTGEYDYYVWPALDPCSTQAKWKGSVTVMDPPYDDLIVGSGEEYYLPPGRHVFKRVEIGGTLYLTGDTEIVAWGNSHDGYINTAGNAFFLDDGQILCDIEAGESGLYGPLPEITDAGEANGRDGYGCASGGSASNGVDGYDLKLVIHGTARIDGNIDLSGTNGGNGGSCEGGEDGHQCSFDISCSDTNDCCHSLCAGGNGGPGANGGSGGSGGDSGDLTIICYGPLYLDGANIYVNGGDGGDGNSPCAGGSGYHQVRICFDSQGGQITHCCDSGVVGDLEDSIMDGQDGAGHGSPGSGGDAGDVLIKALSVREGFIRSWGGAGGSGRDTSASVNGNSGSLPGKGGSVVIEALCEVDDPTIYIKGGEGGSGGNAGPPTKDDASETCSPFSAGSGAKGGDAGSILVRTAHLNDGSFYNKGGFGGDAGDSQGSCLYACPTGAVTPAPPANGGNGGQGGDLTLAYATLGTAYISDLGGGSGGSAGTSTGKECPSGDTISFDGAAGALGSSGTLYTPGFTADPVTILIEAPDSVSPDDNIDYYIMIAPTEEEQNDVELKAFLPPGTSFVSATEPYTRERNAITWTFDTLAVCTPRGVSLTVQVSDDLELGAIIENHAEATVDSATVHSDTVETEVTLDGALAIVARDNPDPVPANEVITYTVKLYNGFNEDLKNTTLSATFPATVTPTGLVERIIPFIGIDETIEETFAVTIGAGLSAGETIESNFEVVTTDFGDPISASDSATTTVGDFAIEIFEPWPTDPPEPDESVTVRGYIRPSNPEADPSNCRLAFNVYCSSPYDNNGERLHSEYVNWAVDSNWEFEIDVTVGDLDNRIEIICLYEGAEVARRDDITAQCEFFVWYYLLTKHLGWVDHYGTLAPYANDFGSINADYESLTQAVYRFVLMYKLNRKLVEDYFLDELGLLIDVLGDLVNPIEIISGALASGGSALKSAYKELNPSGAATLSDLYGKLHRKVWALDGMEHQAIADSMNFVIPGDVQALIAKQAFKQPPTNMLRESGNAFYKLATKLPFAKDDWFLETTTAQYNGVGIKEYCSDVEQSAIGSTIEYTLDNIALMLLEYMVDVAASGPQEGTAEGAEEAYKEALQQILNAYSSWSSQAFRKIATGVKWMSGQVKLAGLATFGTGAATIWVGGSGVVLVSAGGTMLEVGEGMEQASHWLRGAYLAKMFKVMLCSYIEGTAGIAAGQQMTFWPLHIRSGGRGVTTAPDDSAVRTALGNLQSAIQASASSIATELDALVDAYDAFDADEAILYGRARTFYNSLSWQPDRSGFPEMIETFNRYALLRASEKANRASVYMLAAAYEMGESVAQDLTDDIDAETETYLTSMESYFTEISSDLGGADIPASLVITDAGFDDECVADSASSFTVTVVNPGDEALGNASIRLSTDYSGLTFSPEEVIIDQVAAQGTAQANFQITAPVGFKRWGVLIQAGDKRYFYDEIPINLDPLPASAAATVNTGGATLTAGAATLTLPSPGFSPDAYASLAPDTLNAGAGLDYSLAGNQAWKVAVTRGAAKVEDLPSGSQLVITYGASIPTGVLEATLGLYHLDPATEAWTEVSSATQNTTANTFTGTISKTGLYAVLAPREAGPFVQGGSSGATVYLAWEDTHDNYKVYRLFNNDFTDKPQWTLAKSTTATSCTESLTFMKNGRPYLYKVVGIDANGNETRPRNIVTVIPHNQSLDLDDDGMPDQWEEARGLNTDIDDSQEDPDQDGLTNKEEYDSTGFIGASSQYKAVSASPFDFDTDGGGEYDGSEILAGRDPLDARDDAPGGATTCSIAGIVFQDDDGDGLQDDNESGVANVTVTLTPDDGSPQTMQTGSLGNFAFTNLAEGGYKVAASSGAPVEANSVLTTAASPLLFQVLAGQAVFDANFGFMPPPEDGYEIQITLQGFGSGSVSSSPAGLACPFGCSASFAAGAEVTLTATPDTDASFDGFGGDCDGTSPCALTMDQDHAVTATFTSPDTDGDGLPDSWEKRWFSSLSQNGDGDYDIDTLTNAEEYALDTNPTSNDTDGDGMTDAYEVANGLAPARADDEGDLDNDGYSNGFENEMGYSPSDAASYPSPTRAPTAAAQLLRTDVNAQVDVILSGSDPDGFPLTYSVTVDPTHGALSGAGRSLVYTPNPDYRGMDSLTFIVNNTGYDSKPARVRIQVGGLTMSPIIQLLGGE